MPSPKSGTAGTLVVPAIPRTAVEADVANPGAVETQSGQGQSQSASSSSSSSSSAAPKSAAPPPPPVHKPDPTKTGWIEVAMADEKGGPVTSLAYSITLPDGTVAEGTLDATGVARVDGFDPGSCQISFPGLDQEAWSAG